MLPYAYRALDAGLQAVDVRTLSEAARSLGAGWGTVIARVVLPNIRSAVLSASFLSVALVLGEFTVANLLSRTNVQVAINLLGKRDPSISVAVSLAALLIAFALLLVLSLAAAPAPARGPGRAHRPARPRRHPRPLEETRVSTSAASAAGPRPAAARGSAVRLEDLHRSYGDVHALDGLTLDVEPGAMVALLGPVGLRQDDGAAGARPASRRSTGGRVLVDGADVTDVPANKRDMGMVFQAYSLFPHLTALENVAFGLRMRARRGRRAPAAGRRGARARRPLGAGRPVRRRRCPAASSSGSRSPARSRSGPRVLLLDEPLSALDARVRTQLREEIRRIQLEVGTTAVFVTHDQEEALAVADQVGVMSAGRLEQLARAAGGLRPARPPRFVAEFVGLTSRVPATVRDGRAVTAGGEVPLLPGSAPTARGSTCWCARSRSSSRRTGRPDPPTGQGPARGGGSCTRRSSAPWPGFGWPRTTASCWRSSRRSTPPGSGRGPVLLAAGGDRRARRPARERRTSSTTSTVLTSSPSPVMVIRTSSPPASVKPGSGTIPVPVSSTAPCGKSRAAAASARGPPARAASPTAGRRPRRRLRRRGAIVMATEPAIRSGRSSQPTSAGPRPRLCR